MSQPRSFTVGDVQAIPGSEYDNLTDVQLAQLISDSHKLKTGRALHLPSTPPPQPKRVVDIDRFLGGS